MGQEEIVKCLEENKAMTKQELVDELEKNRRSVERGLKGLKDVGLVAEIEHRETIETLVNQTTFGERSVEKRHYVLKETYEEILQNQ